MLTTTRKPIHISNSHKLANKVCTKFTTDCLNRDPNCSQTLEAFHRGVEWAQDGRFTQQDVDEAKLSIFSTVDAPVGPSDKGQPFYTHFTCWFNNFLKVIQG